MSKIEFLKKPVKLSETLKKEIYKKPEVKEKQIYQPMFTLPEAPHH